jgi:RNA polymerase sigma-70 factor (ECF subfamily)
MLASLSEAEDAVQETFLRAWRYRESVREGLPIRPWLYRIATNACLDAIARDSRRAELAAAFESGDAAGPAAEVQWLEPFPDALLEPAAPRASEPEAIALSRETVEIAFLTVIQRLTPAQRAALILRDVLGWSAKETAELLELSVAAANSALQRARATVRRELPPRRPAWPAAVDAADGERELVRRYVEAAERPDVGALVSLIREDATFRMPPDPDTGVVAGRDAILRMFVDAGFGTEAFGRLRCVVTRANGLPAIAAYVRREGEPAWSALAMDVLRIEEGAIAEILTFGPDVFASFGLPPTLEGGSELPS